MSKACSWNRWWLSGMWCVAVIWTTSACQSDSSDGYVAPILVSPQPTGAAGQGGAATEPAAAGDPAAQAGATVQGPDQATPGATGDSGDGETTNDATPAGDDSMGATDPESGAPSEDGDPEMPPEMREDLGEGDGSDVITIGDSWMDYALSGGGIEGALSRAGKDYRNYGLSATQFLNGQIPRQYDTAKGRDANIATVIMTGGGNDVLLGGYSCDTEEQCDRYIMDLVAGLDELWTEMSNDGVTDVIYIRYAAGAGDVPEDTGEPQDPPPVPSICLAGPIRCHSLNTDDLVDGDLVDGIHPSRGANDRIAAAVIELMEEQGMRR